MFSPVATVHKRGRGVEGMIVELRDPMENAFKRDLRNHPLNFAL
jgi:hypothetical protein